MQKNIKIKSLKLPSVFILLLLVLSLFILLFTTSANSKENIERNNGRDNERNIEENKDSDLLALPGEEVATASGKKIKVWSSKGTFKLSGDKSNDDFIDNNINKDVVVVVTEPKSRKFRKTKRAKRPRTLDGNINK